MNLTKLLSSLFLCLSLTACFQTTLGGPTGASTLTIARLDNPTEILTQADSLGPEQWIFAKGQAYWDSLPAFVQLLVLGINQPSTDGLDPSALYLVTVTGGTDYDPEGGNQQISGSPEAIQGSWHAIVSGERIIEGKLKVSALTESLYQLVREDTDNNSDTDILARLNAAAELVMGDVNRDDLINYEDALLWTRTVDSDKFLGDLTSLDALNAAIRAGQPNESLAVLARQSRGHQRIVMVTAFGTIEMETLDQVSPITVANFLAYVEANFYDQVFFHRTINNFMVQTGGFELTSPTTFIQKTTNSPIVNESSNGVLNLRGALAMARTNNPDSATSQFFINQANNSSLNHGSASNPDGYAVFAWVTRGMDIVDTLAALPTRSVAGIGDDVPGEIVVIESVTLTD
jgi:peptidyl-prolyl cis-trans isomerase A (cyclophilin A)